MRAIVLDRQVAIAAPVTSIPRGSNTNINRGSKIMFRMPPIDRPSPASFAAPMERTRCPQRAFPSVGTAPTTMVQNMYS